MDNTILTPTRRKNVLQCVASPFRWYTNENQDISLTSPLCGDGIHVCTPTRTTPRTTPCYDSPGIFVTTPPPPTPLKVSKQYEASENCSSSYTAVGHSERVLSKFLRMCGCSPSMTQLICSLGWVGEQVLYSPLRKMCEAFTKIESHCLHVEWEELIRLRDAFLQCAASHLEASQLLHTNIACSLPPSVDALLLRFLQTTESISSSVDRATHERSEKKDTPFFSSLSTRQPRFPSFLLAPEHFSDQHVSPPHKAFSPSQSVRYDQIPLVRESSMSLVMPASPPRRLVPYFPQLSGSNSHGVDHEPSITSQNVTQGAQAERFLTLPLESSDAPIQKPLLDVQDSLLNRVLQLIRKQSIVQLSQLLTSPIQESLDGHDEGKDTVTFYSSPVIRRAQRRLGDMWRLIEEYGIGRGFLRSIEQKKRPLRISLRQSTPAKRACLASRPFVKCKVRHHWFNKFCRHAFRQYLPPDCG